MSSWHAETLHVPAVYAFFSHQETFSPLSSISDTRHYLLSFTFTRKASRAGCLSPVFDTHDIDTSLTADVFIIRHECQSSLFRKISMPAARRSAAKTRLLERITGILKRPYFACAPRHYSPLCFPLLGKFHIATYSYLFFTPCC